MLYFRAAIAYAERGLFSPISPSLKGAHPINRAINISLVSGSDIRDPSKTVAELWTFRQIKAKSVQLKQDYYLHLPSKQGPELNDSRGSQHY